MVFTKLTVTLTEAEREALWCLAKSERRDTRNQAAVLIREELERRGLIPVAEPKQELAGVAYERTDQR